MTSSGQHGNNPGDKEHLSFGDSQNLELEPWQDLPTVNSAATDYDILSPEEEARLHCLVAANPQSPPHVLAALARKAAASLLVRIAENPRTPGQTLCELSAHKEALVRAAVAENHNTPESALWRLVRDENPDVRYVLSENYHLPFDMLDLLAHDDNPYVAFRARKTLCRLLPQEVLEGNFSARGPRAASQ